MIPNLSPNLRRGRRLEKKPKFTPHFICQELCTLRQKQGHSLALVASRIGVTPTRLGCWERGNHRPTLDEVDRWAQALGWELDLMPTTAQPARAALRKATEGETPRD